MAIPAANVSYSGTGPTASGQVLADRGDAGNFCRTLVGTATFVLDGSLTTATLNYIDGTASLGYNPAAILFCKTGGTASIVVNSIVDGGNGQTATVTFSGAGTNAQTVILSLMLLK